jgi:hypothetical protein
LFYLPGVGVERRDGNRGLGIGDVALGDVKPGWRIFSRGDWGAVTADHSAATRPLMSGPTWGIRPSILSDEEKKGEIIALLSSQHSKANND